MKGRFAAVSLVFLCLFSADSQAQKFSEVAKDCFVREEKCNLFEKYINDNTQTFLGLRQKCVNDVIKNGVNSPEITDSCLNASIYESTAGTGFSGNAEKYVPSSASEILCLYGNGKIDEIFLKRACFSAGVYVSNTRRNNGGLRNMQENIICYNNCLLNLNDIVGKKMPECPLSDAESYVYDSCVLVRDDLEIDSEKGIDHGIKLKSATCSTIIKALEKVLDNIKNPNDKKTVYDNNRHLIRSLQDYLNNTEKRKQELLGTKKEQQDYEAISL